jgi:hypothetical protein
MFAAMAPRKLLRSAATLGFVMLALGCRSAPSGYTTGREFYDLTSQQVARLERRAAGGDRSAAVKLFEYYAIARRDAAQAKRYEKRMRELEHR